MGEKKKLKKEKYEKPSFEEEYDVLSSCGSCNTPLVRFDRVAMENFAHTTEKDVCERCRDEWIAEQRREEEKYHEREEDRVRIFKEYKAGEVIKDKWLDNLNDMGYSLCRPENILSGPRFVHMKPAANPHGRYAIFIGKIDSRNSLCIEYQTQSGERYSTLMFTLGLRFYVRESRINDFVSTLKKTIKDGMTRKIEGVLPGRVTISDKEGLEVMCSPRFYIRIPREKAKKFVDCIEKVVKEWRKQKRGKG